MNELFEAFSTVPRRILDLLADLQLLALHAISIGAKCQSSCPVHVRGRICGTVAVRAPHADNRAHRLRARRGQMWMRIHTLSRTITGGMAIQTAGMSDDLGRFIE